MTALRLILYAGLTLELLMLATLATAAPSVSGITGTLANSESITISGSGFGATGPTVVLFDSFEKGTIGELISTSTGGSDIGNWSFMRNLYQYYSGTHKLSGSKAMKVDWTDHAAGGPHLQFSDVENSGIFISFWQYMPSDAHVPGTNGPEAGLPNWKWVEWGDWNNDTFPWGSSWLSVTTSDEFDEPYVSFMGPTPYEEEDGEGRTNGKGYYDTSFAKGTWMRYSIAAEHAYTESAYLWSQEVSSSGQVIPINSAVQRTANTGNTWNVLSIPGYGRKDPTAQVYIDDVYVATGDGARARVEIGNNATYSSCTKLALLTPTSWGATSVTATVRAGGFAAEDEVYLFVVDVDNTVSSGYGPLTMGGTSAAKRLFRNVRLADPVE